MVVDKVFGPDFFLVEFHEHFSREGIGPEVQKSFHLDQILGAVLLSQGLCFNFLPDGLELHYVHVNDLSDSALVGEGLGKLRVFEVLKELYLLLLGSFEVLTELGVVLRQLACDLDRRLGGYFLQGFGDVGEILLVLLSIVHVFPEGDVIVEGFVLFIHSGQKGEHVVVQVVDENGVGGDR